MQFYDGTKLLSLKDINGNDPEIYISTTNRSCGKTTYFNRLLVNRFLKKGEKFILLYRFSYEIEDCDSKFFNDIEKLFFNDHEMTAVYKMRGAYAELLLDGTVCGYAISINSSDQIKKLSHLFCDCTSMLFDEFQSENNKYCQNEVSKLISIHTSIARGNGQSVRRLPVYMLSNKVSLINPYYLALGISEKLKSNTKYMRGVGFVLENTFNKDVAKQQETSAFNSAFSACEQVKYISQDIYLNDNQSFVERMSGRFTYIATIVVEGEKYSIKHMYDSGLMYVSNDYDPNFSGVYCISCDEHNVSTVLTTRSASLLKALRIVFDNGCFRFKNLKCKSALFKFLSY